jgi:hypothetical protein
MKSLTITKLNRSELKSFIRTLLNISEKVYFSISQDGVRTGMYTQSHDTAMIKRIELKKMMEIDGQFDEVRIGLFKDVPERLLKYLENFDSDTLKCTVKFFQMRGDNVNYAQSIELKDKGLKMNIFCQDPALGYVCLTPEQEKIAFDDANSFFAFDLDRETLIKINSLLGFIKEPKALIKFEVEDDGLHISTDIFDLLVDPSVTNKTSGVSRVFRETFDRLPIESYKCKIFKRKIILVSTESETRIAINLTEKDA